MSPTQSLGTFSIHFLWALYWQSRHWTPCLKRPLSSFLQNWHTVGRVYECKKKRWGMLMRPVCDEDAWYGWHCGDDDWPGPAENGGKRIPCCN